MDVKYVLLGLLSIAALVAVSAAVSDVENAKPSIQQTKMISIGGGISVACCGAYSVSGNGNTAYVYSGYTKRTYTIKNVMDINVNCQKARYAVGHYTNGASFNLYVP